MGLVGDCSLPYLFACFFVSLVVISMFMFMIVHVFFALMRFSLFA